MKGDNSILIIEDDEASAYYLEEILSETVIPVLTADSAEKALKIIDTENICLILMDIRLPDIDGYELTKQLRNRGITIPIIAQTAFVLPDDKEKAIESGCNEYLPKPLRKEILLRALNKHLNIPIPL